MGTKISELSEVNSVSGNEVVPIVSNNATKKVKISTVLKTVYPIGSIYLSTVSTNPATLFGFGTWEEWGKGKVPVGVDTSDNDFKNVEKTGGEKVHKLTVDEMPSHQHALSIQTGGSLTVSAVTWASISDGRKYAGDMIDATGGDKAHNNLQPYVTCYMWKRTA